MELFTQSTTMNGSRIKFNFTPVTLDGPVCAVRPLYHNPEGAWWFILFDTREEVGG